MIFGFPFLFIILSIARKKAAVVRSSTNSKCTALDVAQVKRQIYDFSSLLPSSVLINNGPAKSTPMQVKAGAFPSILSFGS